MAVAISVAGIAGFNYWLVNKDNNETSLTLGVINAWASTQLAQITADGNTKVAEYGMLGEMYVADVDLKRDEANIAADQWMAQFEAKQGDRYAQSIVEIDSIDVFYAEEGAWGHGAEAPYDYGHTQALA